MFLDFNIECYKGSIACKLFIPVSFALIIMGMLKSSGITDPEQIGITNSVIILLVILRRYSPEDALRK